MQTVLPLPQTLNMRVNVCKRCGRKLKGSMHDDRRIGPVCKSKIDIRQQTRIERIAKEYVEREYILQV